MLTDSISQLLHEARISSNKENPDTTLTFSCFVDQIVVPGMVLHATTQEDPTLPNSWTLGSGLVLLPPKLASTPSTSIFLLVRCLGILRYLPVQPKQYNDSSGPATEAGNRAWVDGLPISASVTPSLCNRRSYCHVSNFSVGDRVLGIVKKKAGETYLLDIGCPSSGTLNYFAFEGASKKNRPDIRLKDVIYTAISQADPDLEIELTCMDETGKADGMGILGRHEPGSVGNAGGMNGGIMIYCSLELVRRLSNQNGFPLLQKLSEKFPFEICVGCNGRIWLTTRSARETMLLANTIALADYVAPEVCLHLADELH